MKRSGFAGRDWEWPIKIQNYHTFLPPMLILQDHFVGWWQCDRRTEYVIPAHADYGELIRVYAQHLYRAMWIACVILETRDLCTSCI
jgi:hypothetical protein